jgi:Ca2+-binding RTX toxin-like protein
LNGINEILDGLWQAGVTQFLDPDGRPILYGSINADVLGVEDFADNPHFVTYMNGNPDSGVAIYAGAGVDEIAGGVNDDLLSGGHDADRIDGGGGWDIADYRDSAAGIIIDLSVPSQLGGDAEGDSLTNIEEVEGSIHNDILIGDENDNALRGSEGDDYLFGGGGEFDELYDGPGVDVLEAGSNTLYNLFILDADNEQDILIVGEGYTYIEGGDTSDRIVIRPDLLGMNPNPDTWANPASGVAGETLAVPLLVSVPKRVE